MSMFYWINTIFFFQFEILRANKHTNQFIIFLYNICHYTITINHAGTKELTKMNNYNSWYLPVYQTILSIV
jgi:hypothetical protein